MNESMLSTRQGCNTGTRPHQVCSNVDDAELKNARDLRHAIIRFASEVCGRASGS